MNCRYSLVRISSDSFVRLKDPGFPFFAIGGMFSLRWTLIVSLSKNFKNSKNSKNKSAYLYSLTPSGFEEKKKATYRFLKRKTEEYERLEVEIKQLKKEAGVFDIPGNIQNNIPS